MERIEARQVYKKEIGSFRWEYDLPKGWVVFPTKPKEGDFVEVVGRRYTNGEEVLIGYACPVFFILNGTVFSNFEDCYNSEWFHPSCYKICRLEDVKKTVTMQKENECYED